MLSALIKYRAHVALCFLAFFLVLNRTTYKGGDLWWMAAAFTLLNLAIYVFNKATDVHEDAANQTAIARAALPLLYYSSALYFLLPLLWLRSNVPALLIYIVIGGIGLWYSQAFLGFRLKEVLFVKNLAAAVIWAVPLVLVGAIEAGMATAHLATFGVVFLGVLAVEAMWDVRDLTGDRKFKIKTLPNVLGVNVTKLISLCYLVAAAFVVWAYGLPTNLAIGIGLLGVYVAEVHEERTPAFYHFFMVFWVVIMTLLLL